MYASPARAGAAAAPTPHKPAPSAGPIAELARLLEDTPVEQWQARSAALRAVVDAVPEGAAYYADATSSSGEAAWYRSPPLLRHLALPVGELLKDPRSTVVKRTCESLTRLFLKVQSDGRYLFKDIMPTILSVHAQTVQVIRTAVQEMVLEVIPEVPCKMVMPLWMERLRVDKSRTVREACVLYLGKALRSWTEQGYLTEEIWLQVGSTLLRTLRDPSPTARGHARAALEHFGRERPELFDQLANDPDGPAGKDPKLQRWLLSLKQGKGPEEAEELSVASRFSYNSETRFRVAGMGGGMGGLHRASGSPGARHTFAHHRSPPEEASPVPSSINFFSANLQPTAATDAKPDGVTGSAPTPAATPAAEPTTKVNSKSTIQPVQRPLETPPRPPVTGTPPRHPSTHKSPAPPSPADDSAGTGSPNVSETDIAESQSFPSDLNAAFDKKLEVVDLTGRDEEPTDYAVMDVSPVKPTDAAGGKPPRSPAPTEGGEVAAKADDEGPFIANMQQLKQHASQRRSRNSILMAERFKISGSFNEMDYTEAASPPGKAPDQAEQRTPGSDAAASAFADEEDQIAPTSSFTSAPEHMVIAIRLLRAHKEHVDHIMETLKIEMDTLRDFDKLLEQPGRPTEEEVLDYFESVGLCLDQRTQAGTGLQKEMDRISRGEPPLE